jgi:hypothetical protein
MPDFQTFIAILTALLVFLTGVFLNYDTIAFRNYQLIIPQWAGLLFAGITFSLVAMDQLLRGIVRLEEIQSRDEETRRREENSARATNERARVAERETRRTRIETRYRVAIIRFQLDPNNLHRRQLADILALLEEYQDTF